MVILTKKFMHLLFILNLRLSGCFAWNLSEVELPRDVLIWRFAIWRNRAFLSVPRWETKSNIPATLLEAPWPEVGLGSALQIGGTAPKIVPFPDLETQQGSDCQSLQSVTGLDTDARGRLWILDAPINKACSAKVIIFDLRWNEEITRNEFVGVPTGDLQCLVVDTVVGQWGPRAYIGDPGDESIIVYSFGQRKWWKLKLSHGSSIPRVYSTDLAISRRTSTLYITGYPSHDLFSIDLEEFPVIVENELIQNISVSWLGSKLGLSSGLICDARGGLHYFLITEHASVRWDCKQEFMTESHEVLLQSAGVPCLTDYAMDSQKNIWGLVNLQHPFKNRNKRKYNETVQLQHRTTKVYKYNPFFF